MYASQKGVFASTSSSVSLAAFWLALNIGIAGLAAPPLITTVDENSAPGDVAGLGVIVSDSPGEGVLVRDVMPHSPAEASGMTPGDFILRFDGTAIETPEDLSSMIRSKKVGDRVELELWRDGEWSTKEIRLDAATSEVIKLGRAWLGVTLEPTSADGARIAMVTSNSPASHAKLQAGDLVTAINDNPVTSAPDLVNAINDRKPGEKIILTIKRGGVEQAFTVELGEVSDASSSSFRFPWQFDGNSIPFRDGLTVPALPPFKSGPFPRDDNPPWRKEIEELRKEMQQLRDRIRGNAIEETSPASPTSDDNV